jgi:hypothetical protein
MHEGWLRRGVNIPLINFNNPWSGERTEPRRYGAGLP